MTLFRTGRALLWGAALAIAAFAPAAQAGRHYQILHSFSSSDGSSPNGDLIFDGAGNLYGTLGTGGAHRNGAIFKLSPAGDFTLLYSFTGGSDGGGPVAGLALDPATGDLYGTDTEWGSYYAGCVFELTSVGQLVVLHEFNNDTDGSYANGPLTRDSQGNFYGTTSQGGGYSNGAIFKITAGGGYQVVHTLTGEEGGRTYGHLTLHGADLYGDGEGSIYDFNVDGALTVLATVMEAGGAVARDRKGNLYGGSIAGDNGYIFKLSSDGTPSPLYTFTGGADGRFPNGDMLFSSKRHTLYDVTARGGANGDNGTIFGVDLKGNFALLHGFAGAPRDGAFPQGGLVERNGRLYGTTLAGGADDMGTIFSVSNK